VTFVDKDGDNQGPVLARSYSSGEFETVASGGKGLNNIKLPLAEIAGLFGLGLDDLAAGDQFKFDGSITTTDGRVFGAENSSSAINGSAFAGHFDFTVKATCPLPDDLWTGTYTVSYDDDNWDNTAGFGYPVQPGDVVVGTTAGSTTIRQFTATWGVDIGGFDIDPYMFDFVCSEVQFLPNDTGLACGGGSITMVQNPDVTNPIADLTDDSQFTLHIIEYQDDGECGIDATPKQLIFTKK
jgi:hypothetical protein